MDTGSKMLPWQTFVVAGTISLQWMMKSISWARYLFWWDSSLCAPWLPWCHWEGDGILRPVGLKRNLLVWSNNLRVMEIWGPIGVERKLSSQAACCGWVSLASLICSPRHLLVVSGPAGRKITSLAFYTWWDSQWIPSCWWYQRNSLSIQGKNVTTWAVLLLGWGLGNTGSGLPSVHVVVVWGWT